MADGTTTNLNLTKPEVGASNDTWGTKQNDAFDKIDAVFKSDGTGTNVGVNVGVTKTLRVAGTLAGIAGAAVSFFADTFSLKDATDSTKVAKFDLSGITTGTTRTLKVPDANGTIATETSVSAAVVARLPTGTKLEGYYGGVAPTGFVLACGRTLGPSGSGATERANDDTQTLYLSLWAQGFVPSGGAGASAQADWDAGNPIPLPDFRSATSIGKDNLGGTAKNLIPSATDPKTQVGAVSNTGTVTGTTSGSLTVSASGGGATATANVGTIVFANGGSGSAMASDHTHNFSVSVSGSAAGSLTVAGTTDDIGTVQPSNVVDVIIAL